MFNSDPSLKPLSSAWAEHFTAQKRSSEFTPWPGKGESQAQAVELEEEPIEEVTQATPASQYADAFAQGFEEGRRTVELELADERAAIARLVQSLEVLQPQSADVLATVLAETVERLVEQIVGSVETDPALLLRRAQDAAALVAQEVEPSKLFVNPDDVPLLDTAQLGVALIADPALTRGSVSLECASGWIEDGPVVRLSRLRAALHRIGAQT